VSQDLFTAKDAEDAKEENPEKGLARINAGERGSDAKNLPRINTEDTDRKSGDRVIGASGDRESNTEARLTADEGGSGKQNLPVISTEDTDRRPGEQTLPRMNTNETDKDGELGKMLPQSVGEVYANRGEIAEVHANLG